MEARVSSLLPWLPLHLTRGLLSPGCLHQERAGWTSALGQSARLVLCRRESSLLNSASSRKPSHSPWRDGPQTGHLLFQGSAVPTCPHGPGPPLTQADLWLTEGSFWEGLYLHRVLLAVLSACHPQWSLLGTPRPRVGAGPEPAPSSQAPGRRGSTPRQAQSLGSARCPGKSPSR